MVNFLFYHHHLFRAQSFLFFLCHSYSFCYDYFRSMSCDAMKQESLNVEAGPKMEIPVDDDDEIQSIKVKVEEFTSCENEGECSNENFTPSVVGKIFNTLSELYH